MSDQGPTEAALARLRQRIRELESVLVCYSGGIDSTLVLAVAHEVLGPDQAIAMTAVSSSLSDEERHGAEQFARDLGATHRIVESREIHRPGYAKNGPDRCFHCKSELYEIAEDRRRTWGLSHVVSGTNVDDLGDYRPGLEAAQRAGVVAPLCDAGIGKDLVRSIAHMLGIPIWAKPASACLASRIPYGTSVTHERLRQVEQFERQLRALGFTQVRVRHHEEIARIEVPVDELPRLVAPDVAMEVDRAGKDAGFRFVTVDIRGYRVGSLNELLSDRRLPVIA